MRRAVRGRTLRDSRSSGSAPNLGMIFICTNSFHQLLPAGAAQTRMCRARGAGRRLPRSFPQSTGKSHGMEGLERISSALAGSPIPPSFSPWRCQIAEGLSQRARVSVAYHLLISPSAGSGKRLGWLWQRPNPASRRGTEHSQGPLVPEGTGAVPTTHSRAGDAAAPAPGGHRSPGSATGGWGPCSPSCAGTKPEPAPATAGQGPAVSQVPHAP